MAWQKQALCAQVDQDLFFPKPGGDPRPAQQVCLTCPVRTDCLEHALDQQIEHGVWGGTTAAMRQRLTRAGAA
jgi:WhiB family transcriptional regulator, redox-sensing transcriptional regulator